jgi:hypothetical protein
MTIEIGNYIRKPFEVEAIQVTDENIEEVAKWCKGKLKENEAGKKYILVKVHNAATDRHKQAFATDWVFYSRSTGYKVYSDRAFNGSFDQKVVYTEADALAHLEGSDEATDVVPEIPVAQLLVDNYNAVHGVPATTQIIRDDGTGQFVTEEYAEANPATTVTETVDPEIAALSPEDQARLSS